MEAAMAKDTAAARADWRWNPRDFVWDSLLWMCACVGTPKHRMLNGASHPEVYLRQAPNPNWLTIVAKEQSCNAAGGAPAAGADPYDDSARSLNIHKRCATRQLQQKQGGGGRAEDIQGQPQQQGLYANGFAGGSGQRQPLGKEPAAAAVSADGTAKGGRQQEGWKCRRVCTVEASCSSMLRFQSPILERLFLQHWVALWRLPSCGIQAVLMFMLFAGRSSAADSSSSGWIGEAAVQWMAVAGFLATLLLKLLSPATYRDLCLRLDGSIEHSLLMICHLPYLPPFLQPPLLSSSWLASPFVRVLRYSIMRFLLPLLVREEVPLCCMSLLVSAYLYLCSSGASVPRRIPVLLPTSLSAARSSIAALLHTPPPPAEEEQDGEAAAPDAGGSACCIMMPTFLLVLLGLGVCLAIKTELEHRLRRRFVQELQSGQVLVTAESLHLAMRPNSKWKPPSLDSVKQQVAAAVQWLRSAASRRGSGAADVRGSSKPRSAGKAGAEEEEAASAGLGSVQLPEELRDGPAQNPEAATAQAGAEQLQDAKERVLRFCRRALRRNREQHIVIKLFDVTPRHLADAGSLRIPIGLVLRRHGLMLLDAHISRGCTKVVVAVVGMSRMASQADEEFARQLAEDMSHNSELSQLMAGLVSIQSGSCLCTFQSGELVKVQHMQTSEEPSGVARVGRPAPPGLQAVWPCAVRGAAQQQQLQLTIDDLPQQLCLNRLSVSVRYRHQNMMVPITVDDRTLISHGVLEVPVVLAAPADGRPAVGWVSLGDGTWESEPLPVLVAPDQVLVQELLAADAMLKDGHEQDRSALNTMLACIGRICDWERLDRQWQAKPADAADCGPLPKQHADAMVDAISSYRLFVLECARGCTLLAASLGMPRALRLLIGGAVRACRTRQHYCALNTSGSLSDSSSSTRYNCCSPRQCKLAEVEEMPLNYTLPHAHPLGRGGAAAAGAAADRFVLWGTSLSAGLARSVQRRLCWAFCRLMVSENLGCAPAAAAAAAAAASRSSTESTILHAAAAGGSREVLQVLWSWAESELGLVWNWAVRDGRGFTPLDLALAHNDDGQLAGSILRIFPQAAVAWMQEEAQLARQEANEPVSAKPMAQAGRSLHLFLSPRAAMQLSQLARAGLQLLRHAPGGLAKRNAITLRFRSRLMERNYLRDWFLRSSDASASVWDHLPIAALLSLHLRSAVQLLSSELPWSWHAWQSWLYTQILLQASFQICLRASHGWWADRGTDLELPAVDTAAPSNAEGAAETLLDEDCHGDATKPRQAWTGRGPWELRQLLLLCLACGLHLLQPRYVLVASAPALVLFYLLQARSRSAYARRVFLMA